MSCHSTKISSWSNKKGYFSKISYIQRRPKSGLIRVKSMIDIPGLDGRVGKSVLLLSISL